MISPEQWQLVEEMSAADVNRLRLRYHGREDMHAVIDQIECRQRAGKKLHETLQRAPRFVFPSVLSSEQATSDDLASFHALLIGDTKSVIDMTCGLGIDTFHIAQTGANVTAFELVERTARCAVHNALELGLTNVEVICGDSTEALTRMADDAADCIFVDPARRGDGGKRLFALSDCSPDVSRLLPEMLRIAPRAVIKASPMLDVAHTGAELQGVTAIVALGTQTECKELVIICERDTSVTEPLLSAVTIDHVAGIALRMDFTAEEERSSQATIATPGKGCYLYEPYPATIKMSPLRILSSRYGLTKPAQNSHLYFSEHYRDDFPGRIFRVVDTFGLNKNDCREIARRYPRTDITTRNFPLRPDELQKRIKVRPGGNIRLFATRSADNRPLIIIADSHV